MTEEEITELAKSMLRSFELNDWSIGWQDQIPTYVGELAGHTDWDNKLIRLSRIVLNYPVDRILMLLEHEIAHALAPYENHNEKWAHKLREVRSGCDV